MRYVMTQKWLSLADSFTIKDENGQDRYMVKGEFLSLVKDLSFQGMDGKELIQIKQKLLAFTPTYRLYKHGQEYAEARKELFPLINCRFTIIVPGLNTVMAEGNMLDHEYTFFRRGIPAARISKQWFSLVDTYGIDIVDGEDEVLLLASTVVVDLACHGGRSRLAGLANAVIELLPW